MPQGKTLDAFSRVNAKLIPQVPPGAQVEYELELPGTLDGIVAVAVTSVTREQENSPLSTPWLFVAVPRRNVPGTPLLSLAQSNGNALLTCDFPKAPKPVSVEILRVRREFAARGANTMGPPIHESVPAAWQAMDENNVPTTDEEETVRYRFSFNDTTAPSWFPYLYRAVAVSGTDNINGLRPGRSGASNLITVENLPASPPEIIDATATQAVKLQFRSDAPVETTPRGTFKLQVFAWDAAAQQFAESPMVDTFLSVSIPRPLSGPLDERKVYHSEPDVQGKRTFEVQCR